MPSKSNDQPVLEIDGKFYPIADLPKEVTDLLELFTCWDSEKAKAIREVQKLDAALKSLTTEISSRMAMYDAQTAKISKAQTKS